MKSSLDLLGNTERSSVSALPLPLSGRSCAEVPCHTGKTKWQQPRGQGDAHCSQRSGDLSACCPHVTMPLHCHFSSCTGWNTLTSHGPVSLKIHPESTCFCFEVYFYFLPAVLTVLIGLKLLLNADKMTPSMKLMNIISSNNPNPVIQYALPVVLKCNINSAALFTCQHLSVLVWLMQLLKMQFCFVIIITN